MVECIVFKSRPPSETLLIVVIVATTFSFYAINNYVPYDCTTVLYCTYCTKTIVLTGAGTCIRTKDLCGGKF